MNAVPRPHHLGDGDRLADGATEAEDHRGADTCSRVRKDHPPHHLPARGAEGECALLQLSGNLEEELAADARGDRDDHDRQHEHGDEDPGVLRRAVEKGNEAEIAVQPGAEIVPDERSEHKDPPESQHDARNGRQQLDERGDHRPGATRCQLAQIEPDRNRERRRDQKREERGDGGAPDQIERAEPDVDRIPALARDERQPELRDRRVGDVEDLPADRDQQGDSGGRGGPGQEMEEDVAEAVADPAALRKGRRRGDRVHARGH